MLERGGGAIVNTASGVGLVAYPEQAAYTASKHGVIGLTKVAALDYGAKGVRVNAVCPGTARTPMVDQALADFPAPRRAPVGPAPHRPDRRGVGDGRGRRVAVHPGRLLRARRRPSRRRRLRGAVRTSAASATVDRLAAQGHRIGGGLAHRPTPAGTYLHRYAATGRVQAELGLAGADDVDDAVAAARAAQPAWAAWSPTRRAAVLPSLGRPVGGPRRRGGRARRPGQRDAGQRYAARPLHGGLGPLLRRLVRQARRRVPARRRRTATTVRLEPYGVVAVIPPWNGSMMGMGQKCGPGPGRRERRGGQATRAGPLRRPALRRAGRRGGPARPGCSTWWWAGRPPGRRWPATPGWTRSASPVGRRPPAASWPRQRSADPARPRARGQVAAHRLPRCRSRPWPPRWPPTSGPALLSGQGCALPTRTYVHADVYDEVVDQGDGGGCRSTRRATRSIPPRWSVRW